MGKIRENWEQQLWYEKIIFIVGMLCAVSTIVLALLSLLDIWEDAGYVYIPLLAVLMLVQAFENRRRSRGLVILNLCVAAFISIVWILVFGRL